LLIINQLIRFTRTIPAPPIHKCVCVCVYTHLCVRVCLCEGRSSAGLAFVPLHQLICLTRKFQIPALPVHVCVCVYTYMCVRVCESVYIQHALPFYGVASISRLLKIIGLFCKRAQQKRLYSSIETYNLKEPTNRSHPIPLRQLICFSQKFWLCQYICVYGYVHICVFVCV